MRTVNSEHVAGKDQGLDEPGQQQLEGDYDGVPVDNKVNSEHKLGKDQGLDEPGQQQLKILGAILSVLGPQNSTLVQQIMAGFQKLV